MLYDIAALIDLDITELIAHDLSAIVRIQKTIEHRQYLVFITSNLWRLQIRLEPNKTVIENSKL